MTTVQEKTELSRAERLFAAIGAARRGTIVGEARIGPTLQFVNFLEGMEVAENQTRFSLKSFLIKLMVERVNQRAGEQNQTRDKSDRTKVIPKSSHRFATFHACFLSVYHIRPTGP